ncbi:MAG: DNA alkylation repair protein [Opitutaceae bacterium]|jgi:3-methyladenine DNA glycosylase AlkD
MSIEAAFRSVLAGCKLHANPAIVAKYCRYFSEGYDAYGLDRNTMEELFNAWVADGTIPPDKKNAFALCDLLFAHGKYETASIAFLVLKEHLGSATVSDLKRIKKWFDHDIRNWAHTDVISSEIIAACYRKGIASLAALESWRDSSSKWTRRVVPVTLIAAVKQKDADLSSLIAFVAPLSHDPERVVQQGVGWFLRECWKKDAAKTEKYLLSIKDTAPRLVIQYATEKLSKESRLRFRKTK